MSRARRWTEDELQRLAELRAEGHDVKAICNTLGRSRCSVEEKIELLHQGRVGQPRHRDTPDAKQPYDPVKDNPRLRALLGGSDAS